MPVLAKTKPKPNKQNNKEIIMTIIKYTIGNNYENQLAEAV